MQEHTDLAHMQPQPEPRRMVLDERALEAVRRTSSQRSIVPFQSVWTTDLVKLLNGALATEIVCALRYRRHHFTAAGLASPYIAGEFLAHANEETAHGDRLARRIVQLGGEPDFSPATLLARSHAAYDDATSLNAMLMANLVAECVAIEAYSQMIDLVAGRDPTTRRLLEDILAQEQSHADELRDWLTD